MSCDSRTSKKDRLEKAVIQFNKNLKLSNVINYYPESYTEIKTDSIISNTFHVNIKNYSSMDRGIFMNTSTEQLKKTSQFHRAFESDILVSIADKVIYNSHISAAKFSRLNSDKFWTNATLEHVWVNEELSNTKTLSLGISFINPKDETYKLYEIRIDPLGNERLTLIEDHS